MANSHFQDSSNYNFNILLALIKLPRKTNNKDHHQANSHLIHHNINHLNLNNLNFFNSIKHSFTNRCNIKHSLRVNIRHNINKLNINNINNFNSSPTIINNISKTITGAATRAITTITIMLMVNILVNMVKGMIGAEEDRLRDMILLTNKIINADNITIIIIILIQGIINTSRIIMNSITTITITITTIAYNHKVEKMMKKIIIITNTLKRAITNK
mmetsp:Transcript_3804/g.4177  ORF Transcript_3804/g.4177 Transcript_3804/m.4177 type:complete len:216 (-) Transcript_3804:216-863(-)